MSGNHTYGASCALGEGSNPFTRRASAVSQVPPKIRAHFFYSSYLPIDDPLSPLPALTSNATSGLAKSSPRPFSAYDNAALEEAWQDLQNSQGKKHGHDHSTKDEKKHHKDHQIEESNSETKDRGRVAVDGQVSSVEEHDTKVDNLAKIIKSTKTRKRGRSGKSDGANLEGQSEATDELHDLSPKSAEPGETANDGLVGTPSQRKHKTPFHRREKTDSLQTESDPGVSRSPSKNNRSSLDVPYGSSPSERDTTGTPFLRAPSRQRRSRSPARKSRSSLNDSTSLGTEDDEMLQASLDTAIQEVRDHTLSETPHRGFSKHSKHKTVSVPVGISRLHLVEMPYLQMKPIYWNPVHDISSVVRGTWFYKDTMMPVETDVANQLEEGYEYMKPWTQTYNDEVNSCLEIGPEAELKIVHRLWPPEEPQKNENKPAVKSKEGLPRAMDTQLSEEEQSRKHAIESASSSENKAAGNLDGMEPQDEATRPYIKCSVIYANAKDAQILRSGQLPSVARGRRPLGPVRKGKPIGVSVLRGFDYKAWEKLHPSKKGKTAAKAHAGAAASQSGTATLSDRRKSCTACLAKEERPRATDLVLVIHGIGQKLSERVESFHFTHSINAFRRQINVELEVDAVQPWLRPSLGGIMVLPINWRSTLSLEDGGSQPNSAQKEVCSDNPFTLKDITAETIPAVRNLISDVMLDIPYYLSHHKPKMIEAVVREANRVYRLWCQNNPGFERNGRVHLIAHSLGSVMAIDILSKQPTQLPKSIDLKSKKIPSNIFEFDTKNLFLCGSPVGFFMLLNHAPLIPRKGREKPGADGEDIGKGVAGAAGTYGCLAVDNLYNVMHTNDPIAYRVNACVDVDYSAALRPAFIPSARSSWLQSIGSVFRSKPPATHPSNLTSAELESTLPTRPAALKLPSTIEMETHNFTREELAEKKMLLLNDNGQIDFFLSSGGGPLEIQYFNMLSAHSSYWVLQDFVRFLVVEIGRKAGREETLIAMRAAKKAWGKK